MLSERISASAKSTGFEDSDTRLTLKSFQLSFAHVNPSISIASSGSINSLASPILAVIGLITEPGAKVAVNRLINGVFGSSERSSHILWVIPYKNSFGSKERQLAKARVSTVCGYMTVEVLPSH